MNRTQYIPVPLSTLIFLVNDIDNLATDLNGLYERVERLARQQTRYFDPTSLNETRGGLSGLNLGPALPSRPMTFAGPGIYSFGRDGRYDDDESLPPTPSRSPSPSGCRAKGTKRKCDEVLYRSGLPGKFSGKRGGSKGHGVPNVTRAAPVRSERGQGSRGNRGGRRVRPARTTLLEGEEIEDDGSDGDDGMETETKSDDEVGRRNGDWCEEGRGGLGSAEGGEKTPV